MNIKKLHDSLIYESPWLKVWEDDILFRNGQRGKWSRIWRRDGVIVIPMLDDEHIVLQKEWRYPARKVFNGFTIGGIEDGQSPEEAARAELLEEAGYEAKQLISLGVHHINPGLSSQIVHTFVAKGIKEVGKQPSPHEEIEKYVVTVEELKRLAVADGAMGAFSLSALAKFFIWLDR